MDEFLTGQRFEVQINLDKPRLLRLDFNAFCKAEEVSGLSFLDWNGELTGVRLKALVWAGIVYDEGERRLTYDEVGDALNATALDVIVAVTEAVFKSLPEPSEEGETQEDPQEAAPATS